MMLQVFCWEKTCSLCSNDLVDVRSYLLLWTSSSPPLCDSLLEAGGEIVSRWDTNDRQERPPSGWTPFLKKNMWKCTFDIPSGDKLGFYYKKYFLPEGQYMWLLQCIVVISLDEQSYIYKYTVQCMDTTLEWITSSTVAMGAARDTRTCVWTSLCIAKDAWARILQPTWTEQTYLWRIQIIFFSIPSVDIKPIKDCPSSCWLLKLVFFLLIIF